MKKPFLALRDLVHYHPHDAVFLFCACLFPYMASGAVSLTLAPNHGIAGSSFAARGSVPAGSSGVRFLWDDGRTATGLADGPVDANGFFLVDLTVPAAAPPGRVQVIAFPTGTDGTDRATPTFTVDPTPAGGLIGTIALSDPGSTSVSGATVRVMDARGLPVATATTDANGRYNVGNLAPGHYTLVAIKDGFYFPVEENDVTPGTSAGQNFTAIPPDQIPAPVVVSFVAGIAVPNSLGAFDSPFPVLISDQSSAKDNGVISSFASLPDEAGVLNVRYWADVQFPENTPAADRLVRFEVLDQNNQPLWNTSSSAPRTVYPSEPALNFQAYTSSSPFLLAPDMNVNGFPAGTLTLRVTPYIGTKAGVGKLYYINMVDLKNRWFRPWVNILPDPNTGAPIRIIASGGSLVYIFRAELPKPAFSLSLPDIPLGFETFKNSASAGVPVVTESFTVPGYDGQGLLYSALPPNLNVNLKLLNKPLVNNKAVPYHLVLNGAGSVDRYETVTETVAQKSWGPFKIWRHPLATGILDVPVPVPPCCLPVDVFDVCDCVQHIQAGWDLYVDFTFSAGADIFSRINHDLSLDININPSAAATLGGHFIAKAGAFGVGCSVEANITGTGTIYLPVAYHSAPSPSLNFQSPCVSIAGHVDGGVDCLLSVGGGGDVGPWFWPGDCTAPAAASVRLSSSAGNPYQVDPNPDVAANDAGQAMSVWVQDEGAPGAVAPFIYFSQNNGQTWSAGRRLTSSAAIVNEPKVGFLAADRAVAVWVQNKQPLNTLLPDVPPQLENQEIFYATWDGNTWSAPTGLTSDDIWDSAPVLATDPASGHAMIAWLRLPPEGPISYVYSTFDGRTWSAFRPVETFQNWIDAQLDLAWDHQGQARAVWMRDSDGDLTTRDDRQLWIATFDGRAWSSEQIPRTPPGAFSPSLAVDSRNQPFVAFTVPPVDIDGSITSGVGNRSVLWTAYRRAGAWELGAAGTNVYAEGPIARITPANEAIVLFRRFSEDQLLHRDGDLAAATADLTLPAVQMSTGYLTSDGQSNWKNAFDVDRETSQTFVANVKQSPFGNQYAPPAIRAEPKARRVRTTIVAPSGPAVAQFELPFQPDLAITPDDIEFSDPHPAPAENITITANLQNLGLAPAAPSQPFSVKFYDVPVVRGAQPFAEQFVRVPIPFGQTYSIPVPYTVRQGGLIAITVTVDSENVVFETDKANNTAAATLGMVPPPTGLVAFGNFSAGSIGLAWEASALSNVTRYGVYRATAGGGGYELVGETTEPTFSDTLANRNVDYLYQVIAEDAFGTRSILATGTGASAALVPPPIEPRLSIRNADGAFIISWQADVGDVTLQETPALPAVQWTDLNLPVMETNGTRSVSVRPGNATRFYRLIKP